MLERRVRTAKYLVFRTRENPWKQRETGGRKSLSCGGFRVFSTIMTFEFFSYRFQAVLSAQNHSCIKVFWHSPLKKLDFSRGSNESKKWADFGSFVRIRVRNVRTMFEQHSIHRRLPPNKWQRCMLWKSMTLIGRKCRIFLLRNRCACFAIYDHMRSPDDPSHSAVYRADVPVMERFRVSGVGREADRIFEGNGHGAGKRSRFRKCSGQIRNSVGSRAFQQEIPWKSAKSVTETGSLWAECA